MGRIFVVMRICDQCLDEVRGCDGVNSSSQLLDDVAEFGKDEAGHGKLHGVGGAR